MSATPPPGAPPAGAYPPAPGYPPQPEGRSVAFFVALFLGLLLLVSVGINVVMLVYSAMGGVSLGGGLSVAEPDAGYRLVAVGGTSTKAKARVLRVSVDGAIAESSSPVMGAAGGTVTNVRRQLKLAARSESIKGVLLEINSPGGGVTDSDEIYQLIRSFRRDSGKPVIAYFGDMSASGGYYIAAACDRIYCRPTSITGSIGVIMSSYNLSEAMDKLGIKTETIVSKDTPFKDIMSMSRPMKPAEREILTSIVQEMYERFVEVVDEGRPDLSAEEVRALANGQIYSAKQAKKNKLVDDILLPDQVHAEMEKMISGVPFQLVEQRRLPTFVETLMGSPGVRSTDTGRSASLAETAARFLNSTTGAKFLYFWPGGR